MKRLLPLLLLLATSCTNESASRTTLEDAGYSEISFEGHSFFTCGEGDRFATKFVAVNPTGKKNVKGTVCCGFLKGCTIRH